MNPGLKLKAEAALAVQLIARHRAPQLAAALMTMAVVVTARWGVPEASGGIPPFAIVVAVAVVQGGIVGSRLATPAALATARAAGAATPVMVIGRLAGATVVLVPVLLVQIAAAVPLALAGPVILVDLGLALGMSAFAMIVGRWTGSSAAGLLASTLGLIAVVWISGRAVSGTATSPLGPLLIIGVGFMAVTAGAVFALRERPLRLRKPTPPMSSAQIGHARPR